jgi:multicomponent Na+:H+ antiporter subunit D
MNPNLIFLPILVPLITAILCMFSWFHPRRQRWISLVGNVVSVSVATYLFINVSQGSIWSLQAGSWAAPFGITFVLDALSGLMILLTAIAGSAVGLFAGVTIKSNRASFGFFPLYQFLLMGLCGAFLAGDIFNLYVWFEVIIISSFVLITLGGEKSQLAGAIKYVTLNMLASVIFLTGIAVLYGLLGSLNFADLSVKVAESDHKNLINTIAVLFFVAFGIKSAIFPLYFWLPDSYYTPPAAISAIFAGLLTKVGIYAFIRVFSLLFLHDVFIQNLMMWIGSITMVVGILGALRAVNMRLMFSYLIISHIGIMLAGIGLHSVEAYTGTVYYLSHDIIAKTNLFLLAGLIFKLRGTFNMDKLGGLQDQYPKISLLAVLVLFSVVGTPPLSGFWPKVILLKEAFIQDRWYVLVCILISSLLTLWAIAVCWTKVFWRKNPQEEPSLYAYDRLNPIRRLALILPIVGLSAVSLILGLGFEPMSKFCHMLATQLSDPYIYIRAILINE